jgi:hypothetical protein
MKKRMAAAILWFYAAWFVGAAVAFAMGLSPALAPIMATAAAAIIAVDPRRLIWDGMAAEQTRAIAMARTIRTPA